MDVPAQKIDAPPKDYYCPADAVGGGNCPINFCGKLATAGALAANPPGYGQSGSDALCNGGRVCIVGQPVPAGVDKAKLFSLRVQAKGDFDLWIDNVAFTR